MPPSKASNGQQAPAPSGAAPRYIGRRAALVFAALLSFGLAAGGLFFLWQTADGLITAYQATSWRQTECTLQEASIRQSRGRKARSIYSLHIRYAYSYQGRPYIGTAYAPYPPSSYDKADMEALRQRLLGQKPLHCYIHPRNPGQSLLSTEIDSLSLMARLAGICLLSGVCSFLGVHLLRLALASRQATRDTLQEEEWESLKLPFRKGI